MARDPVRSATFRPFESILRGERRVSSRRFPELSRTRTRASKWLGASSVSITAPGTPIGRSGRPLDMATRSSAGHLGVDGGVQLVQIPQQVLADPAGHRQPLVSGALAMPAPQHIRMPMDMRRSVFRAGPAADPHLGALGTGFHGYLSFESGSGAGVLEGADVSWDPTRR